MPRVKRKPLTIELVPIPREEAERNFAEAIDILADALTDQILEEARAEVAAELGRDPAELDRKHDVRLPTALGGA